MRKWKLYYNFSLLNEELSDKLTLDKEQEISAYDELNQFFDTDFDRSKQGYQNAVKLYVETINLIEIRLQKVTKRFSRIVKSLLEMSSFSDEGDLETVEESIQALETQAKSISKFLETSRQELEDSRDNVTVYRNNLLDKRNRWYRDDAPEKETEELKTPDIYVIESIIKKKLQKKVEFLLEKLEESIDLLSDLKRGMISRIRKQQIEKEEKEIRSAEVREKINNTISIVGKVLDVVGNIFGVSFGIGIGLEEQEKIKLSPKTSATGVLVFEKESENTRSEKIAPFIEKKDGSKIRIHIIGDNPFENQSLKNFQGQVISVSGTMRNGTLRVEKQNLFLAK